MATPLRRLLLSVLAVSLGHVPLAGQASGAWSKCNMDSLATWNCAQYYSGTVTMTSELKASGVDDRRSLTATVTMGRVSCRVKTTEAPEFEAPGMLAVVHGGTENSGDYEIMVWCPDAAGERPSRRDSPVIHVMNQRAADYAALDGKDAHEHPDADSVNGVTGTETLTWHLVRR
jgi:hypothetical protein